MELNKSYPRLESTCSIKYVLKSIKYKLGPVVWACNSDCLGG